MILNENNFAKKVGKKVIEQRLAAVFFSRLKIFKKNFFTVRTIFKIIFGASSSLKKNEFLNQNVTK